jgi:hypothetical protein
MTRQEAKQLLPVIQAFADGKAVDYFNGETWSALHDRPSFTDPIECYRIKPEPKLRPWRPEEVPLGAWFRMCEGGWRLGMVAVAHSAVVIGVTATRQEAVSFEVLRDQYEHSIDGGKTWLPCGIMEDAK